MYTVLGQLLTSPAVIASIIAAMLATLGLFMFWRHRGWANRNSSKFSAFASGILIATAIMLLPIAIESSAYGGLGILGGYVLLYLINAITYSDDNRFGWVAPYMAIAVHSFIDGIGYGMVFEIDFINGLIASIGLIAHEFAEGVILFAILYASKISIRNSLIGAFLGAALTTPIGAVVSQFALPVVSEDTLGILTAITAGALLYVGTTHLSGHLRAADKRRTVPLFILGVILAMGLSAMFHDHDDDHHHSELGRHSAFYA